MFEYRTVNSLFGPEEDHPSLLRALMILESVWREDGSDREDVGEGLGGWGLGLGIEGGGTGAWDGGLGGIGPGF